MNFCTDEEDDTLAAELEQAIASRPRLELPFGHPKFYKRGTEFVAAKPGSLEAGYVRDPAQGHELVKV